MVGKMRSKKQRDQFLLLDLIFLTVLTFIVGLVGESQAIYIYKWTIVIVIFVLFQFRAEIGEIVRWLDKKLPKS